jgi:putative membrane protein
LLEFKWLHLPWLPIALIGTAVAFIVGFKNNASYGRLWEARQIWGGIVNSSRTLGIMVNDVINNDQANTKLTESEFTAIRQKIIYRHIAWMTAHRYTLRMTKPWETFLQRSTNKEYSELYDFREWRIPIEEAVEPYLDAEELKYISDKKNKATQILSLQSKHLRELKEQGLIWEFSFLEMENLFKELCALQGKNERIKKFPYPRQFATLNHFSLYRSSSCCCPLAS